MAAASIAVVVPARRGRRSRWANKCTTCDGVDASEWVLNACTKLYPSPAAVDEAPPRRLRRAKDKAGQVWDGTGARRLEELFRELFRLHDLNGNGLLEEQELIKLNEKIALLHYGKDADTSDVRAKYRAVFRAKLDPEGRPVAYEIFRAYAREVVDGLDTDPEAQEMILEQFVAEAQSGREAFDVPSLVNESDLPFMPNKSVAEIFSKRVPRSSHDEASKDRAAVRKIVEATGSPPRAAWAASESAGRGQDPLGRLGEAWADAAGCSAVVMPQEFTLEDICAEAPSWRRIAGAPPDVEWL